MKRLLLFPLLLALGGCERAFEHSTAQYLAQADQKVAQQQHAQAIPLYEAALDGSAKSAEIHYKLGILYGETLKDPSSAMHHFRRYLVLAPRGAHARAARRFLEEERFQLAASLGGGAPVSQVEARRLKNSNIELQKRIAQLRDELDAAQKGRPPAPKSANVAKAEPVQKELTPGVRTYTVKQGDTFAAISRRFYGGSPARARAIQEANFGKVEGTVTIKPGMVLMIP